MSDMKAITAKLGKAYKDWKAGEKAKNAAKDEFFKAAVEELAQEAPAEKLVEVTGCDEATAIERVEKAHPGWKVDEIRPVSEDLWEAIIVEDPAFLPFSFVNPEDGMVYSRQVVAGSVYVDDERLQQEDPELWDAVSYVPEPERTLRPLDELDADAIARLTPYIYQGKPTVKLAAPRKAKPEEL